MNLEFPSPKSILCGGFKPHVKKGYGLWTGSAADLTLVLRLRLIVGRNGRIGIVSETLASGPEQ